MRGVRELPFVRYLSRDFGPNLARSGALVTSPVARARSAARDRASRLPQLWPPACLPGAMPALSGGTIQTRIFSPNLLRQSKAPDQESRSPAHGGRAAAKPGT